jgi:hypothetical protein
MKLASADELRFTSRYPHMIGIWRFGSLCSGMFLPILVLFVLNTIFWAPALFQNKTIVGGDSIIHSLPLVGLAAQTLQGHVSALWSNELYGGLPLFAGSTIALANPITLFVAGIITPTMAPSTVLICCIGFLCC